MGTRLQLGMLGVALIATAGCDNECVPFTTRCRNNDIQECTSGGLPAEGAPRTPPHWSRSDSCSSGSTCVQPPGVDAMCVLSADPDPICTGVSSYCGANTIVHCRNGYRVELEACGVDPIDPVFSKCITADPETAICVPPEAMPNDVCPPAGSPDAMSTTRFCAGDVEVQCLAGLAVSTRGCALCVEQCFGFLGGVCRVDGDCAVGLGCHLDSNGVLRCTTACDASDPNAVRQCEDLYVAGGPPPSMSTIPPGYSRMTCTAGFCQWVQ